MLLRKAVLEGFDHARSGDRTGHEGDSDWLEFRRRQRFCSVAGPKAVAVACHGRESCDLVIAHEIINLCAFDVRRAVVSAAKPGVSSALPRLPYTSRQILRIGAHIQRRRRIPPDFPSCL